MKCPGPCIDVCGVCDGPGIETHLGYCDCAKNTHDCMGVCNGIAEKDDAGVCNGNCHIDWAAGHCDCLGSVLDEC
jgi:hypothetical protein